MKKRIAIEQVEVTFEHPKTPAGGTVIFNTTIIVSPMSGAKLISKTKSREIFDGVQEAISQIEKQERRSNISKAQSKHKSESL